MNYIIIIFSGFFIGRIIGIIIHNKTKWIDGKAEVDLYMTEKYGSEWTELKK